MKRPIEYLNLRVDQSGPGFGAARLRRNCCVCSLSDQRPPDRYVANRFFRYSRYVAPWIEEALKGFVIILLFRFNRIGYKLDAVISGFAIGAGFSVVENIIYLTAFANFGTGTWLVRGLGTAVMHGTTLAILAAIAHELAERETREAGRDFEFSLIWFVPGYLIAVAIHTAFNHFPDQPLIAMMGAIILAPIALMTIFKFGTAEVDVGSTRKLQSTKFSSQQLRSAEWPDSASGRKIAALSRRLDPETVTRLRRHWELQLARDRG